VSVTPADDGTAYFGLALGILGPLVQLTGLFFTFAGNVDAEKNSGKASLNPVSAALLVGGAGMTAGGWVLYARNRNSKLNQRPMSAVLSPETIRVAAAPLSGGVAMAATVAF
jgi:hypothetical protein